MGDQTSKGIFLNIVELANELKIPKGSIYYWVSRNEIPFFKVGRHLRFEIDAVVEHFKATTTEAKRGPCRSRSTKSNQELETRSLKTKEKDEAVLKKEASEWQW